MRIGRDHGTPARRRWRLRSVATSVLAAFAFLAASMAVLIAGANADPAEATRSASHAAGTTKIAAHQPGATRVAPAERSDAPQHRATPVGPASSAPDSLALPRPAGIAERTISPALAWHSYDLTPARGRAPPR